MPRRFWIAAASGWPTGASRRLLSQICPGLALDSCFLFYMLLGLLFTRRSPDQPVSHSVSTQHVLDGAGQGPSRSLEAVSQAGAGEGGL